MAGMFRVFFPGASLSAVVLLSPLCNPAVVRRMPPEKKRNDLTRVPAVPPPEHDHTPTEKKKQRSNTELIPYRIHRHSLSPSLLKLSSFSRLRFIASRCRQIVIYNPGNISPVAMRAASRALQRAVLTPPPLDDGQDSMKKLAYAPLGFLSLGGSPSYIASILASAVSFLEGYSPEALETDMHLTRSSDGQYVAHTELKLVPYALPRRSVPLPEVSRAPVVVPALTTVSNVALQFSMSKMVQAERQDIYSSFELERFKSSFSCGGARADLVANEILLTTDSIDVADAVLRYSAQVGLILPRSTLEELMTRMSSRDNTLAHSIVRQFQFEMNLSTPLESSLFASHPVEKKLPAPGHRKQSKLERLRKSKARKSDP